jgi:hypothetical protein
VPLALLLHGARPTDGYWLSIASRAPRGIPADALAIKLGSNRIALPKMMFDARRKVRAALVANGYLDDAESRRS